MRNGLISIIIPVYNVSAYLNRCINTVIGQTFRNLEIILIDDGSLDNSSSLCDEACLLDSRIVCIHQRNGGLSVARNTGISVSKGEFIFFLDSDDWLELSAISGLFQIMQTYSSDMVQGGVIKEYSTSNTVYRSVPETKILNKHDAMSDICDYIIDRKNSVLQNSACNKLYKRAIFNSCSFCPNRLWEDVQIQGRIINQCSKIAVAHGIHYHYWLENQESISHQVSVKSLIDVWLSHKDRYDDFSSVEEYADIKYKFILCCFDSIIRFWIFSYGISLKDIKDNIDEIKNMRSFVSHNQKEIIHVSKGDQKVLKIITRYPPLISLFRVRISVFKEKTKEKLKHIQK